MEQFNPSNPEFERVEDLPVEHQEDYVNTGRKSFVKKSAIEEESKAAAEAKAHNKARPIEDKLLFRDRVNKFDVLQEKALEENEARESVTFPYQQDYEELFGKWPRVIYPSKEDRMGNTTYEDHVFTDSDKVLLNFYKPLYIADKQNRDYRILYGLALSDIFSYDLTKAANFVGFQDMNEDEVRDYLLAYKKIRKILLPNKYQDPLGTKFKQQRDTGLIKLQKEYEQLKVSGKPFDEEKYLHEISLIKEDQEIEKAEKERERIIISKIFGLPDDATWPQIEETVKNL